MSSITSRILHAGACGIEAIFAGKTLHEEVLVKPGHPAIPVFLWLAGIGESRS